MPSCRDHCITPARRRPLLVPRLPLPQPGAPPPAAAAAGGARPAPASSPAAAGAHGRPRAAGSGDEGGGSAPPGEKGEEKAREGGGGGGEGPSRCGSRLRSVPAARYGWARVGLAQHGTELAAAGCSAGWASRAAAGSAVAEAATWCRR